MIAKGRGLPSFVGSIDAVHQNADGDGIALHQMIEQAGPVFNQLQHSCPQ
ncbi:hypothetical protein ALP79_200162 [Pseudomonas savastanoi pv. fraxini]|nr:hypothetical protein ALP79_200162 [Pseudomonas savastanoi pv. fraxini]RML73410.1 hypothetical protein ALQ90_200407 [Pseudomonas savastanoi pv. savastanoi]